MGYSSVLSEVKKLNKDVEVVAVSKTKPIDAIMEAYKEGARVFGENRVQEIEEKFSSRPSDMRLYMIGHLQSNKVKKAVMLADRIESVDSIRLFRLIENECIKQDKKIEILLEVNSSKEEQKSGFLSEDELFECAFLASQSEYVHLKGLMTVGPLGFDEEKNRNAFLYAKQLYDRLRELYNVDVLSMGMSADWPLAVTLGSTEVRIGSAIFGERT